MGKFMTKFNPPPIVRERATKLWLDLMEAGGDVESVTALLDEQARDGARLFSLTLGTVLTLHFTQTWPSVLAQLDFHGVSGDAVATGMAGDLMDELAGYLRADVTAGEA